MYVPTPFLPCCLFRSLQRRALLHCTSRHGNHATHTSGAAGTLPQLLATDRQLAAAEHANFLQRHTCAVRQSSAQQSRWAGRRPPAA